MAKALYIECNSGISGDMTLGALIDLGADIDMIAKELEKLHIHGEYSLFADKTKRSGISGTNFDVIIKNAHTNAENHKIDKVVKDTNPNDNQYVLHDYDFLPNDDVDGEHSHRSFAAIKNMIESSDLDPRVKKMSVNIFTVIARAEAAVHETALERVVFHEVGAVDSIIDIVGIAIAVDLLKVDEIYCSQVHDGSGFIECRHGTIPVPVPAVMEMMKESKIPVIINEEIKTEMVTPTGFGVLEGLNAIFKPSLEIKINEVGYGFGNRDTGLFNAVRISLGDTPDSN